MTGTPSRKIIIFYIIFSLLIASLVFTFASNAILPNLVSVPALVFWLAVAALPILYLIFEWFVVYKYIGQTLTQLIKHSTKVMALFDERNEKTLALLDERNAKTLALFDERNAIQKDYIERRLRNLLEVQIATLPVDVIEELKVSQEANKLLKYAQDRRRNYSQEVNFALLQEKSRIREIYLNELFAGIEKVCVPIGAINEETGHVNHVDLLYVNAIARHLQCRNLFEFGTYMGRTTYHLAQATEGVIVTTLNLPPEADPRIAPYLGIYFRGTDREPFIRQIFADSREFDTTPYRHEMDFIFVDGDHSYELVKNDTAKAFEMLAPKGVIIWHDYAAKSPGVVKFFQEFTQDQPVFRIKNTCLLVHLDGVDPLTFTPHPMRTSLENKQRERHGHNYALYHL